MSKKTSDRSVPEQVAYIATVYSHLAAFHLPFMEDLKHSGYVVHAYAGQDERKAAVQEAGFECRDLSFSRRPFALGNMKALIQLVRVFRKEPYQLIHVHTPNAGVITRIAACLAGAKNVVYTAHGFHFQRGGSLLGWLIYYPVEWMMALCTDRLITINSEDDQQAKRFPVRGRCVYMPGGVGVDTHAFAETLGDEDRWATSTFTILCAAELNCNKNQQQLIRSLHELIHTMNIPARLQLAGTGPEEDNYRRLAIELGVEDHVDFLGFRHDIPKLLAAADCLALVSHREGLPKVLLEGLSAGKPLVVTDVRGSRDLVTSGENGWVVPKDDVQATTAALQILYADISLRKRMGHSSRERAEAYNLQSMRSRMQALYNELVGFSARERGDAGNP
ncbi:glycosyltransferase involved in cell wall biosynthesis [Paenibacillus shirakamiensis]|uniref:Glycosyltransferase involved in cell wall biosynthesis n=1 Tax=Paenibacillus shirakamiensis TaxID=1265935 RepID=A0ABS4JJQ8_9BACL|nr:glycosyltransferase family 4 protein [Paenibacillus shirakamiensis]MBP2001945.1 glycosyltransferase involved in cell wall biosynthesis [Paenibacillus shirakamiensis]